MLEAGGKLADLIRGNNLSLQEVREDLHLVGWLEEEGIRVRWTPEDAEWIQTDGTVLNEECPEKGIQTELTGIPAGGGIQPGVPVSGQAISAASDEAAGKRGRF